MKNKEDDHEYLLREDAKVEQGLWNSIDHMVVRVAREQLIGRRFIHIYGPLGSGVQSIHHDKLDFDEEANTDLFGDAEAPKVKAAKRAFSPIPMLYKDFQISWRDAETARQIGLPVDLGTAAAAAYALAKKEDEIIFNGNEAFEAPGLLTEDGRQKIKKSNWLEGDNPFLDAAAGMEKLISKGILGPYALVASPDLYLQMQRLQQGTGLLLIDRVKELVGGKVFQSPVLPGGRAVLAAYAPHYMDLVIGQDIITGYIGPEQLNHTFRIFETALFRIKRPAAVVTFE